MKKQLSVLLLVICLLAGCQSDTEPASPVPNVPPTTSTAPITSSPAPITEETPPQLIKRTNIPSIADAQVYAFLSELSSSLYNIGVELADFNTMRENGDDVVPKLESLKSSAEALSTLTIPANCEEFSPRVSKLSDSLVTFCDNYVSAIQTNISYSPEDDSKEIRSSLTSLAELVKEFWK